VVCLARDSGSVNSCEWRIAMQDEEVRARSSSASDLTAGASPLPDAKDAVTLVGAQRARPWRLRYHGDNFGWSQRESPSVFKAGGKYLFWDFVPGRVFYADTRQMHSGGKLATAYELALFTDGAQPITMQELAGARESICGSAPIVMATSTSCRRQTARSGKIIGTQLTAPPR
jgi:hypothetical protein